MGLWAGPGLRQLRMRAVAVAGGTRGGGQGLPSPAVLGPRAAPGVPSSRGCPPRQEAAPMLWEVPGSGAELPLGRTSGPGAPEVKEQTES